MTKKEKYLYKELKELVESLPPRTRILTVREMMRKYSISQCIIDRVLRKLKEEKLIVSFVGDGMYTTGGEDILTLEKRKKVVIVVPDYPSSHTAMVTECLKRQAENEDLMGRVIYVHEESGLRECLKSVIFDAAVILPKKMPIDKQDIIFIKSLAVPVVVLELNTEVVNIDSVGTDDEYCGAIAANHLVSLGHRRIAVMNPEPMTPTAQSRITGFLKQARLSGIDAHLIDCGTEFGMSAPVKAYDKMKVLIEGRKLDFTGLFIISDGSALGVKKLLREKGIAVPSQFSIIGCDNIPESAFFSPPLTTIDKNIDKWAVHAFEIIRSRFNGDKSDAKHINIVPELIKRESTAVASDIEKTRKK
ncbi:MAG TPA: hypothetical protein DCZ94_02605 [Lentisphaeria bacterium]|nr:MAG: hypothetical protein A2X48_08245 [Lentisphaerae bacterium GWF2_49_21]HBC85826.1 hypothetical protein [Lentisphaeria bacterium]